MPGFAMAAIRTGVDGLIFTGQPSHKIAEIAAKAGLIFLDRRPEALNLDDVSQNHHDMEVFCRNWLESAHLPH